ncbi:Uncharacterized protein Adt_13245 [Abeliophyllum distichum]|uniref:Uncharacterized protein n=1 Tax=Abeliophyllum distichum TaxID=126358 RepID=A0ABD1TWP4_9LAMI
MDSPSRRKTRSVAKKESPECVKKPSKQRVISLDTPTPKKGSVFEKKLDPHEEGSRRRLGSRFSKTMQKNENVDKPMADKIAQSSSSNKINQSPIDEAQVITFSL